MPSQSWITSANAADSDFSIHNIPFGVCSTEGNARTFCATRIGDEVVNLAALAEAGTLSDIDSETSDAFKQSDLATFAGLPIKHRRRARLAIQELLSGQNRPKGFPSDALISASKVQMHLPMPIYDYSDFSIAIEHMKNAGRAVINDESIPPQMPWMPIAYHGRSSSIVTSGTPFKRPWGLFKPSPTEKPILGASRKLDYELELAFFVSKKTKLGERIPIAEARDGIFGCVLMNDWSARDIQGLEIRPLGPFAGKNFATTISPWVVTMDALEPFEVPMGPRVEDEPAYIHHESNKALDMNFSIVLDSKDDKNFVIADKCNATDFYWNLAQLLTYQSLGGCNMNVGDLIATGTCSGVTDDSMGCLLELSRNGKQPWKTASGASRTFLNDGDSITFYGHCQKDGVRVGFGPCEGTVLPADPDPLVA